MRNKTFISSMVAVVAALAGSASAAMTFDSFTVSQSQSADGISSGVNWASPTSSQPIFGASGTRVAFAYNNNGGPGSASVSGGTATFTTAIGGAGLFYSGNAQDLTGYTFSFDLSMTGEVGNTFFEVDFGIANGTYAAFVLDYTTAGTYTVDLSTVPSNSEFLGVFDFTAITDITISMTAQSYSGGSATVSNFTYTPAPGALALLGAAGLVGARRRRA